MTAAEAYDTLLALSRAQQPYSAAEESNISTLYTAVTGKKVRDCNCKDKWHDAIIEALVYLRKNGKMKQHCDYKLRAGVILHVGTSVYSNANLTNEVAAQFLKEHPQAVSRFAKIPTTTKARTRRAKTA